MNMNNQPDYGFKRGLNLERVAHLTPGPNGEFAQPHDRVQIATVGDIQKLATEPYADENHIKHVVEQLKNPRYIRSLGGVGFEVAVLSGSVDTNAVEFHLYGWGGNSHHPNAQREAVALAYNNPDVAHAFINGPGIANSNMLPRTSALEIYRTGSYGPLGEHLAPVVKHVAKDYDKVVIGGHSLGACTAIGIAGHMYPGVIDELRLHDPMGTRKMSLGGIAARFFVREGFDNAQYTKAGVEVFGMKSAKDIGLTQLPLEDPRKIEFASGVTFTPEELTSLVGRSGRVAGLVQQLLIDPSGLRRDAFEGDLRKAAPNVERKINIIIPDMSRLNDWQAICGIVGRMGSLDGLCAEVNQWNLLDHTHANMNQPASLAAIYGAKL